VFPLILGKGRSGRGSQTDTLRLMVLSERRWVRPPSAVTLNSVVWARRPGLIRYGETTPLELLLLSLD
jgi:hypothetical protein